MDEPDNQQPDGVKGEGKLTAFLRNIAYLKYAILVIVPIFVFWLFQRLADVFLNAPAEMIAVFVLAASASLALHWKKLFHAIAILFILLVFYYPFQFVFIESRFFFIVFLLLNILFVKKLFAKNLGSLKIFYYCALYWVFAFIAISIFWPVSVIDKVHRELPVPGIRRISTAASCINCDGKSINLSGNTPNAIIPSADGFSIFASYENPKLTWGGLASFPVGNKGKSLFVKNGGVGAKILHLNPLTGAVYTASMENGDIYEFAPDTLRLIRKYPVFPKKHNSFPTALMDVPSNQLIVPDMFAHSLDFFRLDNLFKPWRTIKSGGLWKRLFPDPAGKLLPGTWSLNSITFDKTKRRAFLTYGVSRHLVAINMDDNSIIKIDTGIFSGVADTAIDTAHETLFLAEPLGWIEYYDTDALEVYRRLPYKGGFKAIAYDPKRDMIIGADYYKGNLEFIDPESGETVLRRFVCLRATDIAIAQSGKVYVACSEGVLEVDPEKLGLRQ